MTQYFDFPYVQAVVVGALVTVKIKLKGDENVKIDRQKYMIARARACMGQKDLEAAGIPKGTLCRVLREDVRPETVGKIAKALNVDVTEIIE